MKKLLYVIAFLFLVACGSSLTYNEAIEKNNENYSSEGERQDSKFLVDAKSYSLLIEQLGQIGADRGYAVVVQNYGNKIKQDHNQLNEQLKELSKNENIKLPSQMNDQHKQMLDDLKNTVRQEFDKKFIRTVERAYEDNIELFKNIATKGSDDDIRAFAAKKLSMLRINEDRADELEDELI